MSVGVWGDATGRRLVGETQAGGASLAAGGAESAKAPAQAWAVNHIHPPLGAGLHAASAEYVGGDADPTLKPAARQQRYYQLQQKELACFINR